ncbi:8990_t:CDS:2 [Gigaspora margarita]|uniref:8990_t:CDS:1 n=1 Tax=Gigaspora margarita TaxID=4874 RepID=A0ABM8W1T3_GIGMA|nr:8990_t:CDS:2 [Gigaspora margarita]
MCTVYGHTIVFASTSLDLDHKTKDKWWKYYVHNEFLKEDTRTTPELILNWHQKARQELAPYLQKLDLVDKSFGYTRSNLSVVELYAMLKRVIVG